VIYRH